jgi:hypothetical protein
MIELACQNCGNTVGVKSFLAAAQQPCRMCGRLLMGSLGSTPRITRPGDPAPAIPAGVEGAGSPFGMWSGILLGAAVGIAGVVAFSRADLALPWHTRNAILGALSGVMLSPVFAVSSFLSMLILPFSLEGVLGDSMWERIAKGVNHRTLGPLFLPTLVYVVFPMAVCAYGASKMRPTGPSLVVTAAIGAAMLGATLGGIAGAMAGPSRRPG